ncbi:MAG TPA: invasion associated locus B family protein [Rhizomicrobium sp.]|nr:invasion associated locus B family protein [Rhizomicrobium sp.]
MKREPVSAGLLAGAFAGLVLVCGAARAQQTADAPPPSPPETKSVGDWTVRCFAVKNGHPCDMFQEMANKDTKQRILTVSLAYDPGLDKHLMQLTVPLDVALQKGVTIQTDTYTSPVLKYRMCSREGCFVQMVTENSLVEALTKSGPAAKINIVGDNGKAYGLQFSLKGFSAAHDDLVSQARAKAVPAAKSANAKP